MLDSVPRHVAFRAIDTAARFVALLGSDRWCPVCEKSSRRFLPYGVGRRRDVKCPWCGSAERHRLIWLYLSQHSDVLAANPRVLHMAPERTLTRVIKPRAASYVTVDLYASNVDVRADITKALPLPDHSFDLVLCNHMLEHVDDDAAAMRELVRLTAPGGTCIVTTPIRDSGPTIEDASITDPDERTRVFGQADHVRLYGLDLDNRLTAAGFDVTQFVTSDVLSPTEVERMRMQPNERIFVCRPREPVPSL